MKFYCLSDLHNEFGEFSDLADPDDYDAVLLAGDIDLGIAGVGWANTVFKKPVFYIMGNHEYYGKKDWYKLPLEIDKWCEEYDNVIHLEKRVVDVIHALEGSGHGDQFIYYPKWENMARSPSDYTIIGTSLWTYGNEIGAMRMNDYRQIMVDDHNLRLLDTRGFHEESVRWLERFHRQGYTADVVMTHHAPHKASINLARYGDDWPMHEMYFTDLEKLILKLSPKLWLHGHTHSSSDYMISDTRVVSNPRGYVNHEENPDFNPHLIIEV